MSTGRGLHGGIVCSLVTPFRADESPDLDALRRLIDFQIIRYGQARSGEKCEGSHRQPQGTHHRRLIHRN
jgi:hypothetical protein